MQRGEAIDEIRRFNRTYLPFMQLMNGNYLDTGYSLTEARVLFEVRDRGECSAREVCSALGLDKGYLSRIVRKLERAGLVERGVGEGDARVRPMRLTQAGRTFMDGLETGGVALVARVLEGASDAQCAELAGHMAAILRVLGDVGAAGAERGSAA